MQSRRLRLGDILDDYCPRERRITNHAVVAMIDDEVKQTRCTTCDADHEYKQAKVPAARRKKLEGAALGEAPEALLRRPDADVPAADDDAIAEEIHVQETETEPVAAAAAAEPFEPGEPSEPGEPAEPVEPGEPLAASGDDDGPVHRRLIRATLPRPDGQVPERKMPDFTIRQPGGRGGREFDGNKNGQRPGRRPMRFGVMRSGSGSGSGSGQQGPRHGSGQGQPRHGSGSGQRQGGGGGNRPPHGQRGRGGRKRGR